MKFFLSGTFRDGVAITLKNPSAKNSSLEYLVAFLHESQRSKPVKQSCNQFTKFIVQVNRTPTLLQFPTHRHVTTIIYKAALQISILPFRKPQYLPDKAHVSSKKFIILKPAVLWKTWTLRGN